MSLISQQGLSAHLTTDYPNPIEEKQKVDEYIKSLHQEEEQHHRSLSFNHILSKKVKLTLIKIDSSFNRMLSKKVKLTLRRLNGELSTRYGEPILSNLLNIDIVN